MYYCVKYSDGRSYEGWLIRSEHPVGGKRVMFQYSTFYYLCNVRGCGVERRPRNQKFRNYKVNPLPDDKFRLFQTERVCRRQFQI